MEGWIKLHRQFLDHWLCDEYRPLTKREAWENMLFWANINDQKVLIKGELIDCNRGQICYSLETWAKKLNWSVSQVRQFFKLLENDKMIITEGLKYTTRLTICNYDNYQDKQQTDNKLTTNCLHSDDILPATSKKEEEEEEIILLYNEILEKEIFPLFDKLPAAKSQLKKWDDCYRLLINNDNIKHEEIIKAITWARNDSFWRQNFMSFLKLRDKDKYGTKYIDIFLTKSNINGGNKKNFGTSSDQRTKADSKENFSTKWD